MNTEALVASIEASDSGPQVTAMFDFDGTLISGYSALVFLQDAMLKREAGTEELTAIVSALTQFGRGKISFSALMDVHAQQLAGQSEKAYMEQAERLFRQKIARLIYPEARRLIDAHKAKGHTVAIISSATRYQVEPAAQELDIEHVYTTGLAIENGVFTGEVIKPTCFGPGKVSAAKKLTRKVKGKLSNSFFYSDSTDDLDLLEAVGNPVALNPNKKLRGVARAAGWPNISFSSRGTPSVTRVARSLAATGSLVSAFAAGLPIYALTGSKRDAVNFSTALFGETSRALIGMDLNIRGEEHLWAHRPCVFMFNHQSKADVPIMASLVRRDVVGVGKKEIERMPLIGKVMGYAGTVFIDRSDRKKAIDSMQPLIDAMKNEGKSLVIAPEGTRTPGRHLAPFKKGGFHMAMDVGVPIVPIVIHNAGDIAPKGDFTFRPGTVDIDVLPAVETRDWTLENMDHQVNEVRNCFLRALGQPELTLEESLAAKQRTPDDMRPELKSSKRQKITASGATKTVIKARKARASVTAASKTTSSSKTAPKQPAKAKRNVPTKAKTSGSNARASAKPPKAKAPTKTNAAKPRNAKAVTSKSTPAPQAARIR